MRICYMPVISARNIESAPSYQYFKALHRHAMVRDPETVFYVLAPEMVRNRKWRGGADWKLPRTHVIEIPMHEDQWEDLVLVPRDFWELFNERFGRYHFDVLLTEKPMLAPLLKKLSSFHIRGKSRHPLVVCRDQFTVDDKWYPVTFLDEMLQAAGWVCAPTIFQSDHQAKRALQIAGKHVTPAHLQRMAESMKVFPLGIDCADVDLINMTERGQKNPQITINYSHKIFGEQRYIESLAILDSVFAGGRDVRLQVVTGSSAMKFEMVKDARRFRYMDIFGNQSRQEFLRQMAKAHIFISNSIYEDFSATVVEQIYTGLIPVLVRKPWATYLVGEDYPYLFSDPTEGNAMMRYVVDHYEQVRDEVVPGLQQKMRERFDLGHIVPATVAWLEEMHQTRLRTLKVTASLGELVEEAFQACPPVFTEKDLYGNVRRLSRHLDPEKDNGGNSISKWLLIDWLLLTHPEVTDLGGAERSWSK